MIEEPLSGWAPAIPATLLFLQSDCSFPEESSDIRNRGPSCTRTTRALDALRRENKASKFRLLPSRLHPVLNHKSPLFAGARALRRAAYTLKELRVSPEDFQS